MQNFLDVHKIDLDRAVRGGYTQNMLKRWTPEEDAIIIRDGRKAEIEGRTSAAVQSRYYYLVGCGEIALKEKQVRWTPEEHELLYLLKSEGMKWSEIAKRIGRSLESCKTHYKRGYGFPVLGYNDWSEERLLELVQKYKNKQLLNYCRDEGEPSAIVIERRFGSWSKAMELAGVVSNKGNLILDKKTLLYLIDFGEFKKIGITQRSLELRFSGFDFKILDLVEYDELIPAWETEQELLKILKPWRYKPIELIGNGATECFKLDSCCDLMHPYQI